jgi:hypothetical protein
LSARIRRREELALLLKLKLKEAAKTVEQPKEDTLAPVCAAVVTTDLFTEKKAAVYQEFLKRLQPEDINTKFKKLYEAKTIGRQSPVKV